MTSLILGFAFTASMSGRKLFWVQG